ncbi:MAG: sigma-54 dependent transcriptional regulator [Bacteroidota bacterium]
MATVLIIDDEEKLRALLGRIIALEGFRVLEAGTIKAGLKLLQKEAIDLVLCDVKLPDGNGVAVVKDIKQTYPFLELILLTAYGNIADGVQAMKNGAFDYITKGDDNDRIIPLLHRAMEKITLHKRVQQLEERVQKKYGFDTIIGQSKELLEAIVVAKKVAATDATVLLLGETGTGKEVFAQAIHNGSNRSTRSFQAINCSALSKEILESELFGYKAGAFTGAVKDKKGLLEEADGGTLFLDEIGDMPIDLQTKLLRVLEDHSFIKVGDTQTLTVNVRVVAATNRDLANDVREGRFREDLFYRLNVFIITLPPLRERKKDIPVLADFFMKQFASKTNVGVRTMSSGFTHQLQVHEWKGNIRELKNVMERAVILADGAELTTKDLPLDLQTGHTCDEGFELAQAEKIHIQKVLRHTNGNKTETAKLLNIGIATLYRKIEEYKLG